ncbi:MAG: TonB family protein [Burkholderiales bacterium]
MRDHSFLLFKLASVSALALCAALLASSPVFAQSSADKDKDGKISDAERARRDAEKVFSFIKFHTVRPAAAPRPAPRPAAAPVAAAATAAPAVSRALAAPAPSTVVAAAPVPELAAPAPAPAPAPAAASALEAAAPPATSAATLPPSGSLLPSPQPQAPVTQPVPEPEPEPEPEEVPLKLLAYVAPDMSAQVMAAMTSSQVIVPVRFVVQPDGKVSSAVVRGSAPRKVAQSAVRAVQQWRFDKIPAVREVDVEIAFKAATE